MVGRLFICCNNAPPPSILDLGSLFIDSKKVLGSTVSMGQRLFLQFVISLHICELTALGVTVSVNECLFLLICSLCNELPTCPRRLQPPPPPRDPEGYVSSHV